METRLEDLHALERRRLATRLVLAVAIVAIAFAVETGIRMRREASERDAAFSSAMALAGRGRPTQQAVGALESVMDKYPDADQVPEARRTLQGLTENRERQRTAIDAAIARARSAGPDGLSTLAAARTENPDAPNLADVGRAEAEIRNAIAAAEKQERDQRAAEKTRMRAQAAASRDREKARLLVIAYATACCQLEAETGNLALLVERARRGDFQALQQANQRQETRDALKARSVGLAGSFVRLGRDDPAMLLDVLSEVSTDTSQPRAIREYCASLQRQ